MPSRNVAVAARPNMQAVIRGVRPLKSAAFTATAAWRYISKSMKYTSTVYTQVQKKWDNDVLDYL